MAADPRLLWGTSALASIRERALSCKKPHVERELPHAVCTAAGATASLGTNTLAVPPWLGDISLLTLI